MAEGQFTTTNGRKKPQSQLAFGERFGRLVITAPFIRRGNMCYYPCRCDCGGEKVARAYNMLRGRTASCGCLVRLVNAVNNTKHGMCRTGSVAKEHMIWRSMIARCHRPNDKGYPRYGGRGIYVCDRWRGKSGFENFYADMGPKPGPRYSIDRIDNDGPYSPDNCRWVTQQVQMRNTRVNHMLTYKGETKTLVEWVEATGISDGCIRSRLKNGWSVEDALSTPSEGNWKQPRRV